MTAGYIYCYLGNDSTPDLASFERLFGSIGLYLENPEIKQVLTLSPTGEQIAATRGTIVSQLAAKTEVNVQWWFDQFEDVYCGFHTDTMNGQWRVTFGLDGIEHERVSAIIERVVSYFKSHCARGDVAALVVDRSGAFEEIDWDAVVCGSQLLLELPDILVLPRTIATPGFEKNRSNLSECPLHDILNTREGERFVQGG